MNGNVAIVFYVHVALVFMCLVVCIIERVGVAIITRCVLTVKYQGNFLSMYFTK